MAFTAFPPAPVIESLTAKGDLLSHDGASDIIKTIGSDGQALRALASDPAGLAWQDVSEVPTTGTDGHFLRKTATASVFEAIRQVTSGGSNGQVLTSNGSGGYSWVTPSGGGMVINTSFKLNGGTNYTVPSGDFAYVTFVSGATSTRYESSGANAGMFVAAGGQQINGSGLIGGRTMITSMNSAMVVVMSN